MTKALTRVLGCALACSSFSLPLFADFSYQETSQMTGGALLGVMKFAGVFAPKGQKPTDPMQATVAIHGNRMLRKTAQEGTIIDLDKRTITTIHFAKKAYSVVTFDQMKQQLEKMTQSANSAKDDSNAKGQASVQVKVSDTGQSREISGLNTHEMLLTITMAGTDANSGATGQMNVVSDMWISPDVPGYQEVNDFHQRMAKELNWVPGDNPLLSRPDLVKGMSELYEQGSKLKGLPLETKVQMTGSSDAGTAANSNNAAANGSGTTATSQSDSSQSTNTSMSGALTSALGSRFGLGRRKKKDDTQAADAGSGANGTGQVSGSLIELTTKVSGMSDQAVDTALFDVPAGFKQVEEEMPNRRTR